MKSPTVQQCRGINESESVLLAAGFHARSGAAFAAGGLYGPVRLYAERID